MSKRDSDPVDVRLKDLEVFCEVVHQRSFSKAAQAFSFSQSVASETVKDLETRLGVQLLDRSQRPPAVTKGGEIFFEGCHELLDQFRRLVDRVQQLRDKVVGTVRVAAIYSVGLLQMERHVKQFEERYPDAALKLRYLHPDKVIQQVLSDEADLGLVSFPNKMAEMTIIPWQEQEIVVIVPPQHRLANFGRIRAAELGGLTLVGYTPELAFRKETERWLKSVHATCEFVQEFDNIEHIKRAVEIGSGAALVPLSTVKRELEIGSLKAVQLQDARWVRPLGIIHRKNKSLTTAAQRFLDLLLRDPESQTRPGQHAESAGGRAVASSASDAAAGTEG